MLSLIVSLFFSFFYSSWGSYLFFMFVLFFFMVNTSYEFYYFKINSLMECDNFCLSLMLLSVWLVMLSVLASNNIKMKTLYKVFILMLNSLLFFLILSFSFNNYILFYLSFECSILPITFLILGWGYQPERAQAGIYLVFYTLFASLPLLVLILMNSYFNGSNMCLSGFYTGLVSGVNSFFLISAFLVKFPMYITHLWLPKAHVEAPVAGSMILAGILLKLGGYGMIRFMNLVNLLPNYLQFFLIIVSTLGGVLISLVCMNHMDMKSLVAYSSVVHMSTCISCILTMNEMGFQGAYIMMIAHGLSSSGFFFLIGVIYERSGSRSLLVNKGLMNIMPSLSLIWFLVIASNMSAPPFINLLGEIYIFCSLLYWSGYMFFMLMLLVFFSACYNLYLFSLSQHGKFLLSKQSFNSGLVIEFLVGSLHIIPLFLLILYVGFMN
uniref:NADH-ubiquinone oxidoreductase chain 4 n=1 Tax=Pleonexes koreana TaxID=2663336 RepID=A0A5P9W7S5_9CRUS|nr:NADH dehydrogenase subunit 4 [Pleonexes koreana]